jgi:cobaltochelatase CobS
MSVATATFTPSDAALAISNMTEAAARDIPFTKQAQYDRDYTDAEDRVRNTVTSVMRAHGLGIAGDRDEGTDAGAEAVARACAEFENDPAAYIASLQAEEPEIQAVPVPIRAVETEAAALPLGASHATETDSELIESFDALEMPHVPQAPTATMRFVDRIMSDVFPDLPSEMGTMTVPTARWTGEAPQIGVVDEHYSFDGYALRYMALAMRNRKNIIATGEPGCGKTEFFKQFAARVGLPFYKLPMDGSLSRPDIIGSFRQVATSKGSATPFVLGLLPTIIQTPCIIDLDEIDQADPDLQYMLHSLYEGEGLRIQEDGGRFIARHPNCYLVATANTKGRGSDNGLTHARNEMSEATRDRYAYWLEFSYLPKDKEVKVISAKSGIDMDRAGKLVDIGNSIRDAYRTGSVSQPCSLRQLLDVADSADGLGYDPMLGLALACETVIIGRANPEDAVSIRDYVKNSTNKDLNAVVR